MNNIIDIKNGKSYSIFSNEGRNLLKMYIKHYVSHGGMYDNDDPFLAAEAANDGDIDAQSDSRIGLNSYGYWNELGYDGYRDDDDRIYEDCDLCDGEGEVDCPNCEGGDVVCETCDGVGELNCPYCNNMELRSGLGVGCRYCVNNPITQNDIYGAEPGKVVCPTCMGENRLTPCTECDETGNIQCEKCDGTGRIYI